MTSPTSATPRQRRRWGRKLLVLFLSLLGLLVVGLAVLFYVVPLDSVKEKIVSQAETALQRQVEVGRVRLQILTGLGAGLEELTISNPPGWQRPDFVKVGTFSVKVAFWPLLQRKIEVSRIILSDGEVVIERDEQGRMNYADLTESKGSGEPSPDPQADDTPAGASPLAGLLVSKVSLRGVDVTFIDRMVAPGKAVTTTVQDVQADVTNIALNTPIDFDIAASLLADGDRNVELRGRLGPIPETLAFDQVPLNITLQAQDLVLDALTPYMGPEPAFTAGRFGADVAIEGRLGGELNMKGSLSLAQMVLRNTTDGDTPTTLPEVTLTHEMTVDLAQAVLQLAQARLDLASLQLTLKGTVRDFSTTPQLDLELASNEFAPDQVLAQLPMLAAALPESTDVQGQLQLQATVKGTPSVLQSTAQIDMREIAVNMEDGQTISLPQARFTQESTIDLEQAVLQLTQARLDLATLQLTVQGTVRDFSTTPQLDLELASNEFAPDQVLAQLPMLAAALPESTDVQGQLQLQATAKGTPSDLRTTTRVVVDQLLLNQKEGMQFETTKMLANVEAHLATPEPPQINLDLRADRLVFDQQAAAATPPTESTTPTPSPPSEPAAPPFDLRGKVTIGEGRINQLRFQQMTADISLIKGLLETTQAFTMYGGGFQGQIQANLAEAEPDYTLQVKLADLNTGNALNDLTSVPNILFGKLNTDLAFSGKGFTWEAISTSLTGKGNVKIGDLKVTSLDLLPKLAAGLQTVSTLANFTIPADLAERSFNALQCTIRLVEGKIQSDDVKLWGPDVELLGKGFLGLDQSLKFEGTALLLGKLASAFGPRAAFLQDEEGRIGLPLAVQGSVTKPQIALNESYLVDLAKKSLTKQVEEKAGKELQKLLDKNLSDKAAGQKPAGALKNILEQALPGQTTDPTSEKADDTKEQAPQQQIQKTLRNLLRR